MKSLQILLLLLLGLTKSVMSDAKAAPISVRSGSEVCSIFDKMEPRIGQPEVKRGIEVDLGKNVVLRGNLVLTSKGNGTMELANLMLRVYDQNEDGVIYKNGCLPVEFKDLNGDGYNDLVASGIVVKMDEEENVLGEEPVRLEYEFLAKQKIFKKKRGPKLDYIDLR